MARNIQSLSVNSIKLDQENVRFGGDVAQNQREALDLMMADPEDAKKIVKLAEHIAKFGLDPTELQLVTPDPSDESSYIVLEGNRRLTALKLLQNPDLASDSKIAKSIQEIISAIENLQLPSEVECSVVPDRKSGDIWIELKHTGPNGGVGRVGWDSDIRDERRARLTGVESIGRQIRNLVKDNKHIFSDETVKGVMYIPVTTLTRLFSSKPAQEAFMLQVKNRVLEPNLELHFIAPSVDFAINLFTTQGYNVNDIRNHDDRVKFIGHIPPELLPVRLKEKAASTEVPNATDSGQSPNSGGTNSTGNGNTADDSSNGNNDNNNSGNNRGGSGEDNSNNPKIKAKPSTLMRKHLIPWSLKITNSRINEIYRELRHSINVHESPNAAGVMFRVFLELTLDTFISNQKAANDQVCRVDNHKPIKDDDKLSVKLVAVVSKLEQLTLLDKSQSRAIRNRATGSNDSSIGSIEHLNQLVHNQFSAPIPTELNSVAETYKPLFDTIWG
ncbi:MULTISPECIES: hypothetical protein [Shewanella]|uniref:hypothetical protein n=1 Tax=Shewanella TaxID=22 RepID=UPI000468A977|nr:MULTISPECIES: hypothetical protein [Shewanella]NJI82870.1 hypothetical protein [Shewanella sp. Iso12]NKZ40870.1 hypothetical protein [Shewanella algae]QTE79853.1 hypothetical protein E1N14_009715 [Shewanella algae]